MRRFFAAAALTLALAAPAGAQTLPSGQVVTDVVFTTAERKIICEYFKVPCPSEAKDSESTKGKGKAEKGEKAGKVEKADKGEKGGGKGMPPGLAKREMPTDLASKLPTRAGLETVIVDKSVVLVEEATNTVLDVIANVVTK